MWNQRRNTGKKLQGIPVRDFYLVLDSLTLGQKYYWRFTLLLVALYINTHIFVFLVFLTEVFTSTGGKYLLALAV